MSKSIRWIIMGLGLVMVATVPAAALLRATDRGEMKVSETGDQIFVEAYEWVARHDKSAGGCLGSVYLKEVDRQLLGGLAGARVNQWFEKFDRSVQVDIETPDWRTVLITVRGHLCDAEGTPSPIAFTHLYKYRREYLRHELTLSVDEPVAGVTEVVPFEMVGIGYESFAASASFEHDTFYLRMGPALRGAIPTTDGLVWEETMPARYLGLFTGGFGGIDWFLSSQGVPWRWTQGPDKGSWRIEVVNGKPQLSAAAYRQEEPITLDGPTTWSFYTSWPCVTKSYQPAAQSASFLVNKMPLTTDDVQRFHEAGCNMVMPAATWDSIRWVMMPLEEYTFHQPDNSVPLADAVAKAHELGMTVVPYICVLDICITNEEYARIGDEIRWTWSENPEKERWWYTGGTPGFRHGAGCYCSENWKRLAHPYLEQAWKSQDFDGLYYDFADLVHCSNPAHCGGVHMKSDGLFELCDWTRELMGPGKILFLHAVTETHPCYAVQNYADYIIFYEGMPGAGLWHWFGHHVHAPDEFYQDFTAANNTGYALSHSVYLSVDRGLSPGEVYTKFALWNGPCTGLLDPKTFCMDIEEEAKKEKIRISYERALSIMRRFEPYDLSTYEFVPLVHNPAEVSYGGGGWASAWKKDGEVLLLVANLHKKPKRFRVTPQPIIMEAVAGGPLEITIEGQPPQRVAEDNYMRVLRRVQVPAEDFILIRIVRLKHPPWDRVLSASQ